jgi:predicted lipoprotein with Yx(FWY)xxD motif
MNWRFPALVTAAALATVLVITAASPALAGSRSTARASAPVKTTAAHILVNPKGRTLYIFASDSKDTSTCYDTCATYWPPVTVKQASTPAKIGGIPGRFGVTTRTDGTKQLTYDGAPLYTFAGDKKKGDMKGQGVIASGNYWWVVVAGK